jgi:hypothetical protein
MFLGGNILGDVNNVSRLYKKKETVSQANLEKILQLLGEIKYGSVTLVIQDGVLIQIETNEKIRLK